MSKWDRERREPRKSSKETVKPNKKILVVCEGQTEEAYVKWLKQRNKRGLVEIQICNPEQTDPHGIVKHAKEQKQGMLKIARSNKNDFEQYDEVWCVFDDDERSDVMNAIQFAQANNIKLAYSNPCFELWVYLHLRERPGMRDHQTMQSMVKKIKPDYKKGLNYDFDANFSNDQIESAINRSKKLQSEAQKDNEPYRNPVTYVFALCNSIRDNSD